MCVTNAEGSALPESVFLAWRRRRAVALPGNPTVSGPLCRGRVGASGVAGAGGAGKAQDLKYMAEVAEEQILAQEMGRRV